MPTIDRRGRRRRLPQPDPNVSTDPIGDWLAGRTPVVPWEGLLSPGFEQLPARWAEHCREHPGARAPDGLAAMIGGSDADR